MPNGLSPSAKQQFFTNSGTPAASYKLFTYAAGTTTKLATTISASGANNTNPIILDYRGECDLWIPPNVAYKYVLAPPTDTDPPSNPIWTVDQIINSQLVTLYGGVDTGSANAYALNFTANFSSYVDGTIIYWIPSNTNTGPSTLNVNGLGAVSIATASGLVTLRAGTIVANQITAVIYRAGNFYLLSVSVNSGSFPVTLTGYASPVAATVVYKIAGDSCSLSVTSTYIGASNSTAMGMTGVPSYCWPSSVRTSVCSDLIDNSNVGLAGVFSISETGAVTFGLSKVLGASIQNNAVGFTAANNKGLLTGWSVTYPL